MMVAVSVKSENINDKRFFSQGNKLRAFLKLVKNQATKDHPVKVRFKQFRLN